MQKIVILDFSTSTVYVREVETQDEAELIFERVCSELDIRSKDCQWMIGDITIDDNTSN